MESYYTNKERHIHLFLSDKGWTDEDISRSMFSLTTWTAVMGMSIEQYYKTIMKECGYIKYKSLIEGVSPDEFSYYLHRRRMRISVIIVTLSLLATILFTLLRGGA